ncbi:glutarate dioxygenase GlaH [Sphingobium sp. CECT 9361]|uniref:glutarate dioxygenase GlaH n=1 Tax=Sphingobium sp. CECT 9361 TaxID=2845384 RepID=UPI001E41990D|nr:glutarate dioxygenase GlaH [Sphingobium sp. CECT 9361]CAH0356552.1 Glutarate 2-hydroxylase [Sphingobium sp. CECT 9361]
MQHAVLEIERETDYQQHFTVRGHPYHKRLHTIEIPQSALEAFFAEVDDISVQNLEYVPFMRFVLGDSLERACGYGFAEQLRSIVRNRASGGFEIGVRGVRDDADSYVKFGTAISHLLGPANHDAMSHKYYARFLIKDTDNSDSYLRQAYRLFTLHTDGTFVDEATDWLLMMKFAEENATGGESRLMHIDDWDELPEFANAPLAKTSFVYQAPGSKNVAHTTERPLFFESEYGLSVSFIDQFVQPRTMEEALFLKRFSESMEASPGTVETPLPVGNLVVLNNYFWLHGRAPFQKHELLNRELMRQRGTLLA